MRACLVTVLLGLAGLRWNTSPAQSQPLRTALIISNAQYADLPPLPRCTASAAMVRDALKAKGFEVVERSDVRRGEFDAAIGALAKRTAASPPSVAVLYFCGYAREFNGRSFLLPAAANIARDNDVLTQGLISKSLVDSLARVGDSTGVVLLDGFQPPGASATGLARLVEQIQPGSFAVIGVNNDAAAPGPTATAQALRAQLTGEEVSLEKFVGGMRGELAKGGAGTAFVVAATGRPSFLIGGKPPPPPPAPAAAAAPPPPPAPAPASPNAGAGRQCAAGRAGTGRAAATGDGRRRPDVRSGPAAGPGGAGHAGLLFRPHRRHLWPRNSRCHPSLSVRDQGRMTGRLSAEQATKLVNSVR